MQKIFSFDIGIASIGWAVMNYNKEIGQGKLINAGVFTFPKGENPDGSSLAKPRREARSSRRRFKRRKQRIKNVKKLLQNNGYEIIYNGGKSLWQLRFEALNRKLENAEFAKILLYFAKKRGYLSSIIADNDDSGKVKKSILDFRKTLTESCCKTAGQYLYQEFFAEGKRIKNASGSYSRTLDNSMVIEEINTIFEAQKNFGNEISNDFAREYIKIQQSKAKPDAKMIEVMVGKCTFESNELRAPKESISFQIFRLLQTLNNLKIEDKATGEVFQITNEHRAAVLNLARKQKEVKYSNIRKTCKIPENFKFVNARSTKKKGNDEDGENICSFKLYYDLQKIKNFDDETIDELAFILATCKDTEDRKIIIKEKFQNLDDKEIVKIAEENTSKFGHLSLKAVRNISPFLLEGETYDKACTKAGYEDFRIKELDEENITNPVVKKVLNKYKKLLNAMQNAYGKAGIIKIETTRELGKSKDERKKIENQQRENENKNREANDFFYGNANGKQIVKHKLWIEQGNQCLYSGKQIEEEHLRDDTMLEIDHIIPYSRCFDDSFANKILCFKSENQCKRNQTPYEYLSPLGRFEEFANRVNASTLNRKKKEKCLIKDLSSKEEEFKERNLNDTRYVTRLVKQLTEKNDVQVMAINGGVTAFARKALGFAKDRNKDDTHHALDAIMLGVISQGFITNVNTDHKSKFRLKEPWENFKKEVEEQIQKIKVVRFPRKKVSGSLHKETIYGNKDGVLLKRIGLEKITDKNLERMHEKNGGAKPLYEALKNELANSGKITLPFIFAGNQVQGIKITEEASNTRQINRGYVMLENMVRVDIYKKDIVKITKKEQTTKTQFYGVPVYAFDILANKTFFKPTKIAPLDKEQYVDKTYSFMFSLYADDLVRIVSSGGVEYVGYYKQFVISNCNIVIKSINGDEIFRVAERNDNKVFVQITSAQLFEKYQIDYFGNISKITKEKPPYDISELDNNAEK